jgi:hypothetical protein
MTLVAFHQDCTLLGDGAHPTWTVRPPATGATGCAYLGVHRVYLLRQ